MQPGRLAVKRKEKVNREGREDINKGVYCRQAVQHTVA